MLLIVGATRKAMWKRADCMKQNDQEKVEQGLVCEIVPNVTGTA